MENDIFKAGVMPGSPTSHNEIKMLICYLLLNIETPISFAQLHEALSENSLVNYFELVHAMEGLIKSNHLTVECQGDSEQYTITEIGIQAGREFESSLPLSIRDKAMRATERQLRKRRREAEVSINVQKLDNGYFMELAIPEKGDNLIAFSLFLPTQEECELVRRRFLNDPVFIYKGVLALLTGNREVLGRIFPQEEPLFP